MKRREVSAPDASVQVYGISLTEWDAMQKRLMVIEELLLANAEYDVNGAPLQRPVPSPTAYDVLKTFQMLWAEGTSFPVLPIGAPDKDQAGTEFNYGNRRYTITVQRY
jgi:hypothetical protein